MTAENSSNCSKIDQKIDCKKSYLKNSGHKVNIVGSYSKKQQNFKNSANALRQNLLRRKTSEEDEK